MPNPTGFVPIRYLVPWPEQLLKQPDAKMLDRIGVTALNFYEKPSGVPALQATVALIDEIGFELPGLNGFSIVFGASPQAVANGFAAQFDVEAELGLPLAIVVSNVDITLRMQQELLKPVVLDTTGKWVPLLDAEGKQRPFEIGLTGLSFGIDHDGDIELAFAQGAPGVTIGAFMIADTGIVVEADQPIQIFLSRKSSPPPGATPGFRGVHIPHAVVHLPGLKVASPTSIEFTDCFIGSGGFSGTVAVNTAISGELFGVAFVLQHVALGFEQSIPTACDIAGALALPFFDAPVEVEIGIGLKGELSVALSNTTTGLKTVAIGSVMVIELDSLGFDVKDGELTVKLGGKLTPTFGGLNWPSFDVKELSIDSKGHVQLEGGWLDLPKQYSLDFHGFKVEITKFGFGRNQDGTKWVGASGGVELVKGLPAGASVKGLRITADEHWANPKISFEGVGVEFEVPGVFQFKGEVDYREFNDPYSPGNIVHRFDGDITLKLEAMELEIDGTLVAGSTQGYNFFALYVDVELPEGIPWGELPFAFYGFAGMLALNMGPGKTPADPWYDLSGTGWYQKNPTGVEKLEKWTNIKGNRAFAVGTTVGTYEDGGYLFNGRMLLAVILPGPVVAMQGAFNLLTDRDELGNDPMFRTIAVYDKPGGTLLFGVDAKYQYDKSTGKLIQIAGGLEAFYDFNNPANWFIHLGEEDPRENRIQARVLSMFDANAYFMLDAHKLAMGAWIGYQKQWHLSKLSVALEAWMESNAVVSFKPAHLTADMWVHGSVQLKILKFGLGLSVDALIEAEVFKPYHLLGDFNVSINLPKPLKDISAEISLEWGPEPDAPPRPIVFKEAAIEHFKSSVKWPQKLGKFTLPSYDDGSGFLTAPAPGPDDLTAPSTLAFAADIPCVPMDCRPTLSFARNVWDDALIGAVVQMPDPPWQRIGDPLNDRGPANARFHLNSVRLDKYDGTSWSNVATAAGSPTANAKLYGSWGATSAIGGNSPAQNKLTLWSLSGFDQFRSTGADWSTPFHNQFPNYPCIPKPQPSHVCLNFDNLRLYQFHESPFRHPDHNGVSFDLLKQPSGGDGGLGDQRNKPDEDFWDEIDPLYWKEDFEQGGELFPGNPPGFIAYDAPSGAGHRQELCPLVGSGVVINFDAPANDISITAVGRGTNPVTIFAWDAQNQQYGPFSPVGNVVAIPVSNVMRVALQNDDNVCIVELCGLLAPPSDLVDSAAQIAAHNSSATTLWSGKGNVLEPFTQYRLRVETSVETKDFPYDGNYNKTVGQVQYAYFQTGGPPGIGLLSVPENADGDNFDSGLDDLTRYVDQTVPPTVPKKGELPISPRPVYRGYDASVVFNENYVSLMYRMAGRDLNLRLCDRNNRPVRGLSGRLIVADNPWDVKPITTLSASDGEWTTILNASGCVSVNTSLIKPHEIVSASSEEQLLESDMLYEARLVPSLLHEDFMGFATGDTGPQLGRWHVADHPATTGGPSQWKIELAGNSGAKRIAQNVALAPIAAAASYPAPPGTRLMLDDFSGLATSDKSQPGQWTDVRLSLYLRSSQGSAIGATFRGPNTDTYYAFVMDRLASRRCLVCVNAGAQSILAQDTVAYDLNTDYRLVVEAIGSSLRIYLDDALVFDVVDATIAGGGMALYCSGGVGAAFSDIQVQDFGVDAVSTYKFSFTTSPFADFHHHMHSFEDGCWKSPWPLADADLAALASKVVTAITTVSSDAETAAFEEFATAVLGQQARQPAAKVEISRIESVGTTAALLVRGPQPFGFSRDAFAVRSAAADMPVAISPTIAKLSAAALRAASPAQEAITLTLLEPVDLSLCRIEMRDAAAAGSAALDDVTSQWSLLFKFPQMVPAPDGARITVYACSPDVAPPCPLRTVQYFRAAQGDPATLALDADAVDLRLVSPDGSVIHARRFLKDAAYQEITGCTFLRSADETAFAIFPPSGPGAGFAPASYRLGAAYRLDNTAFDSNSATLSQAGQTAPESANLDFSFVAFNA